MKSLLSFVCGALASSGALAAADGTFSFPDGFEGHWRGKPTTSILGPFSDNITFQLSKAPNGDYLLGDNLVWGGIDIGWQRFYVEGSGETAGSLWYCGDLTHYADFHELTGMKKIRLNLFLPQSNPEPTDTEVSFCLDTSDPAVISGGPWPSSCSGCSCANWTLSLTDANTLRSHIQMAGAKNHTHSHHLLVDYERAGPELPVTIQMPGHGANFDCNFTGRDNLRLPFDDDAPLADDQEQHSSSSSASLPDVGLGCPFLRRRRTGGDVSSMSQHELEELYRIFHPAEAANVDGQPAKFEPKPVPKGLLDYENCYVINPETNFTLRWTLDNATQMLHIAVSASTSSPAEYVSVGFRPLGRARPTKDFEKLGTGAAFNFGMEGADIVVGAAEQSGSAPLAEHVRWAKSSEGIVGTYYAYKYTGPPSPSTALKVTDASATWDETTNITTLVFSRPLVSGMLARFGVKVSIDNIGSDLIWAIGPSMNAETGPAYHGYSRGLRRVDWSRPEIAMHTWQCGVINGDGED